ncbi:MAG: hypothetical protein H7A37_09625 [Chlamydiales bacterium]|nr:hypothetical protein [Chlamydiia bacterium]MCP5508535.1 hypothetical protein [Chlamydiales bacterium]
MIYQTQGQGIAPKWGDAEADTKVEELNSRCWAYWALRIQDIGNALAVGILPQSIGDLLSDQEDIYRKV